MVDGTNASNIVSIKKTPNVQAGTMQVTFNLNKYLNSSGIYIDSSGSTTLGPSPTYTISGFKTTGLTTTINPKTLSGFTSVLPSNVTGNDESIKQAIISAGAISNPAYGNAVSAGDISYTVGGYDNINGTVSLAVTIGNNKYWSNGTIDNNHLMNTVTFSGFAKTLQTVAATDKNINDAAAFGSLQATPEQVNTTFVKDYIVNHLDSFMKNTVPGTSADNILDVTISQYNPTAGTIEVSFNLNTYTSSAGQLVVPSTGSKLPSGTFILGGFDTTGLTTKVDTDTPLTGVSSIFPSDVKISDTDKINQIKQAILRNISGVTNKGTIDPNTELSIDAINDYNNINGTITLNLTISGNKYWENGVSQASKSFTDLTFSGFKQALATEFVTPSTPIDGTDPFGTKYADQVTNEELKTFIFDHASSFYINPVPGMSADNIVDIHFDPNMTAGSVTLTFRLNKYLDKSGHVVDGTNSDLSPTFTINGFKTANGETTIKADSFNLGASVSDLLPLDITNDNEPAKATIVNALMSIPDLFMNVAYEDTVNVSDVSITNIKEQSNINGTIVVDVVLGNNKYWNNGTTSLTHTYPNITLSGFKQNAPTTFKPDATSINAPVEMQSLQATQNQVTDEMLKTLIANNITTFVEHPLPDTSANNIIFEPAPTWDTSTGTITLSFKLDKFVDENGVAITDGSKTSTTSPSISITGFSTEGITTLTPTAELSGFSGVLATSVQTTDVDMMNQLKTAIASTITGVVDKGSIDPTTDLAINSVALANDVAGSIQVNYTIKNNKYWENGVIEDNKPITQFYSGFKKLLATDFVNPTTNIDGNAEFGDQYASDRISDDVLKQFIIDHHDQFIIGMVDGTTANNIVELTKIPNVQNGTMQISFKLNKYLDATTGVVVDNGTDTTKLSPVFTISGFKNTDLTTSLEARTLSDVKAILPSSVCKS